MFENSGKKIKVYAKIGFWIEVIACIGLGFLLYDDGLEFIICLFAVLAGVFAAYILSLFLYAFGELVETVMKINSGLKNVRELNVQKINSTTERLGNLNVMEINNSFQDKEEKATEDLPRS